MKEAILVPVSFFLTLLFSCNVKEASIADLEAAMIGSEETREVVVTPIEISPEFFGFGTLLAGGASNTKEVGIKNISKIPIYFSKVSLEQDGVNFSLDSSGCIERTNLNISESCILKVTFAPLSEGPDQATVAISYGNAAGVSNFTQRVSFNGVGGTPTGNAAISFTPTSHTFSSLAAGSGSESKSITLKNISGNDIYLTNIGGSSSDFTVSSATCSLTLAFANGSTCSISAVFHPSGGGIKSSSVVITYGLMQGTSNLSALMSLTGTGVASVNFSGIDSISAITTTTATINWTEPAGVSSYYVFRVSGGTSTLISNVAGGNSSYALTGLSTGTSYSYRVNATDSLGILDSNTNEVTFSTVGSGTFVAISNLPVAEGATAATAAMNCDDPSPATPSFTVTSQSDTDSSCTISGSAVSCSPAYKTGHSAWTSNIVVTCSLNGSSYTQGFTVNIADTNRSPSLTAIADETVLSGSAMTSINADDGGDDADADLDALLYSCTFTDNSGSYPTATNCSSLPGTPSFTTSTGAFTWTTNAAAAVANAPTIYTITLTASDQQSSPLTDTEVVIITVNPSVTLNTIADQTYAVGTPLVAGLALSPAIDLQNTVSSDDTSMTYICTFDQTVDNAVVAGTACTSLPGTATFLTNTGVLNWTPSSTTDGLYEIKIVGNHSAGTTDDEVFVILVRPPYVTTSLFLDLDAKYGDGTGPGGSGNPWMDLSGSSNHADLLGGTSWTGSGSVASPYQLAFNGSSGAVDADIVAGMTALPLTLTLWVKFTELPSLTARDQVLMSTWLETGNQRAWKFFVSSADQISFSKSSDGTAGTVETVTSEHALSAYDIGEWIQLGVTIDASGNYKLYKNGLDYGSGIFGSSTLAVTTAKTYLGAVEGAAASPDFYLKGSVAKALVYSRALSSTELNTNYSSLTPRLWNTSKFRCPLNYVRVPANVTVGATQDFCMMKYEAKISIADVIQPNGDNPADSEINLAQVSLAGVVVRRNSDSVIVRPAATSAGKPWAWVRRSPSGGDVAGADTLCASLGSGYSLTSNAQWQAVGRNAELVGSNWSGNAVGSGALNRGHSDNGPASALAGSTDSDPCSGTTNTNCTNKAHADYTQKRTHLLSTDEIIWDLAGNVWEWVSGNNTVSQGTDRYVSLLTSPTYDLLKWGPTNDYSSTHTSGEYAGLGNGWLNYSAGAVLRGGCWANGAGSGLFTSYLNYGPANSDGGVGFRCVWLPQ